jgi:hypothetical protein
MHRMPRSRALLAFVVGALAARTAGAARFEVGPYLQDARPDGVVVMWETDAPVAGTVIVEGPGEARHFESPAGTHHEVRVTGIEPGRHRYRVVAGDAASAPAELATAATGEEFTFLVYGDNRDLDHEHARVVSLMIAERADLALNTGDLTADGADVGLWRRFFSIEEPLLGSVPMYPALGNHEVRHDPQAEHYHRFFALPGPDESADAERYYAFHYANAEFIALDANQSQSRAQADWLRRTLDAAALDRAVQHVFVFFHQSSFSAGPQCGSAVEQGLWVPEFERHAVRAVFTGHDHSYQHLERNGIRYFVSGGGGAPLYPESTECPRYDREAKRLYRAVHHFVRVRVRGPEVVLDAISADGEVFETVRLHEPAPPAEATPIPYLEASLVAAGHHHHSHLPPLGHDKRAGGASWLVYLLASPLAVGPLVLLAYWAWSRRRRERGEGGGVA